MIVCKKVPILTLLFSILGCFVVNVEAVNAEPKVQETPNSTDEAEFGDDSLLGEQLSEKLRDAGIDADFRVYGNGILASTFINQGTSGGKENAVVSFEGNIHLEYLKKMDGFGIGFKIGTKPKSGLMKAGDPIFNTSYIFVDSDYVGEIRIGYVGTAADKFCINGGKYLAGYQGFDSGSLGAFYNVSAGSDINTGCIVDDGKSAKVVWHSPVISGFSMGASFTPNSRNANPFKTRKKEINCHDDDSWDFASTSAYGKNIVTIGGMYEYGSDDDFNAAIAVAGWSGKGESGVSDKDVRNILAFNIGAVLGYKDFKMSLGYTDNGRSLLCKEYATADMVAFDENRNYDIANADVGIKPGANCGKIYSIGMSYTLDKIVISAGYYKSITKFSSSEKSTGDVVSIAAQYDIHKALSLFAEYNNIVTRSCDRARAYRKACELQDTGNNRANMLMLGVKFKF